MLYEVITPSLAIGLYSGFKGVSTMWKSMAADAGLNKEYRPSVGQFIKEFLWPSIA